MVSFNLTSSAAIVRKAGTSANSTIIASTAALSNWCDQAEGVVNTLSRYDWITNSASIGANFFKIVDEAVSDWAAMQVILYDMSGYTSRLESQLMLDALRDRFNVAIDALKDTKNKEPMGAK